MLFIVKRFFVFSSFFIFFFAAGFYIYHLSKFPSHDTLSNRLNQLRKYYPDDILIKTGSNLAEPELRINHFLKFPIKKKRETTRVGTFGDSHTFGVETHKEANYPAQLQKLFEKHFTSQKVEVLNFGKGGHSFQQQFFLWEKYAKLYGIDYILYGPRGLYYKKDLTFAYNSSFNENFRFPRNRFFLSEKEGLKLASIKGIHPEDQYKNYYSLIPSLTALRYGKRPFQLWESYFPFLRERLKNPFYYSSDLPEHIESPKINKILLKKIRKDYNKKILLLVDTKWSFESYSDNKNLYNLNFFDSLSQTAFLYKVFGHKSSLGNELVASVYFNALTGKKKFSLNVFNCYFNKMDFSVVKEHLDFKNVKRIFIGTKNTAVGEIRLNSSDHYYKKGGGSFSKIKNTKSLIGFSGSSVNDFGLPPYFPVPFELNKKSKIYIISSPPPHTHTFSLSSDKKKFVLGHVKPLDVSGKIFNFYANYISWIKYVDHTYARFQLEKLPLDIKAQLLQHRNQKTYLYVDNYVLGELLQTTIYGQSVFILKPKKHTLLMMGPMHLIKEQELPSDFPLYIHYFMEDARVLKSAIPEWSCIKKNKIYKLSLPNFKPIKKTEYLKKEQYSK